jgi:hypothetical protein
MQICTLIGVFATMVWPSTLVTVCQYDCPRYTLNVHRTYGSQCKSEWKMTENDEDKIIAYLEMRAVRNNVYFRMLHSDGAAVAPLRQQVEILDEHIKNYLERNPINKING